MFYGDGTVYQGEGFDGHCYSFETFLWRLLVSLELEAVQQVSPVHPTEVSVVEEELAERIQEPVSWFLAARRRNADGRSGQARSYVVDYIQVRIFTEHLTAFC